MYNRSLQKETRKKPGKLNSQLTAYTSNRQVRARKSEEDEFIMIESMQDVSNLS